MTISGKPQTGDQTGYGWLFPLRYVGGGFESGSGFELVKSAAEIIIGAQAASEDGANRGDFPANHRLGTHLNRYLHRNIRGLSVAVIRAAGLEGLTRLDPRIIIDPSRFSIETETSDNRIRVAVGIRTDPEFTGESTGGTVSTTI